MIVRRRSMSVLTVWLTAATTLFATSPHFECVCPDGTRKPFCLSSFLGDPSCCGQETCASAGNQHDGAPSCCCASHGVQAPKATRTGRPRFVAGISCSAEPGVQQVP